MINPETKNSNSLRNKIPSFEINGAAVQYDKEVNI